MSAAPMKVHRSAQFPFREWFEGLFRREPFFAGAGVLMIALIIPTLFAMALDSRTLLDVNVWEKPLKFQVALAVYLLTLAWYSKWVRQSLLRKTWYRIYSGLVVFCVAAEMVWLMGASANGVPSHFNFTSALTLIAYQIAGLFAVTLLTPTALYGIMIWRHDASGLAPAMRAAFGSGLILTFVLTIIFAGYLADGTSHFVGGNLSDAEGVPVMGWARDGGDLRVAHFFATHALHFIPLAGLLAVTALPERRARITVYAAALAFTAFVVFTFIQALMGQPFIG
ncbi:MAG: hypothetical protein KTR19_07965 [Hyphomicrobiales bacterium]|nr:hypothetical protein [Hyphomicrobiales bacterium]